MNYLSIKKEKMLAYFLAAYCIYYLTVSLAAAWGFTTDDAYISWYYARQLAAGKGLLWQMNSLPVEGYSNFLWVMIAYVVIKLNLPLVVTMKWISVFSLGFCLIFLYRLSRLFVSPLLAMLPVFLFSHYTGVVWWTVSGLESTFFCALAIALIEQCSVALGYTRVTENTAELGNTANRAWINTNLLLLLLSLTRFEGVVWGIPILFFLVCRIRMHGLNKNVCGVNLLWGIISLCCFVIPYVLYFSWRLYYFGHWAPNSYLCKALVPGQIGTVDLDYLGVTIPLIVASLPYFLFAPKDCRGGLLGLPSLLYLLMLWQANPLLAYDLRLFLAPFALFTLLSVLGVFHFLQHFRSTKWDIKLMTSFVMIILTFALIPGNHLSTLRADAAEYQGRIQSRMMIVKMLNEQALPGARVLLGDCGLILFNARPDLHFIDSQCLNNVELTQAIYSKNLGAYADILQQQVKPEWVIVNQPFLLLGLDFLTNTLEEKHFFKDYQLIATFRARVPAGKSLPVADYYWVYKRKIP